MRRSRRPSGTWKPPKSSCSNLVNCFFKPVTSTTQPVTDAKSARAALDAWTREVVQWHFDPATGCPFWLERAKTFDFDPRRDIQKYEDLDRFGFFEDEWLRGGPVTRWVPKAYDGK